MGRRKKMVEHVTELMDNPNLSAISVQLHILTMEKQHSQIIYLPAQA